MFTGFIFSHTGLEMALLLVGKLCISDMLPGEDPTL